MSAINPDSLEKPFIISAAKGEIPSNFRHVSYENLCISASKQPSEEGLFWIFQQALTAGKSLHVVDLREEPHFFASGNSITYYNGLDNDDNKGLSLDEINEKEHQIIEQIKSQETLTVYGKRIKVVTGPKQFTKGVIQKNKNKSLYLGEKTDLSTIDIKTEASYVQTLQGAEYTRIPFTDHRIHEMMEQLDKIIAIIKTAVEKKNIWIHFHCHGGKGRAAVALLATHVFIEKPSSLNTEKIIERFIANDHFKNERKKYQKSPEMFNNYIAIASS